MKIQTKIILPHVYMLKFESQYELCMSFIRIQEFYESPKFRNKYFTLEDYMDYWSPNFGKGSFTYPSVWGGFNVPGKIIKKWHKKFRDIRPREQEIFRAISKLASKEFEDATHLYDVMDKIYVIGVFGENNETTVQHEIAHALYSLYPDYKKMCKKLLEKMPSNDYNSAKEYLRETGGYCENVMDDELQAYFSASQGELCKREEFIKNFEEYKKKIV